MNAERRLYMILGSGIVVATLASACFKDDPCGAGLVEVPNSGNCVAAPPPPAPASDASSEGGGDGGDEAAATNDIGKACSSAADCGPTAPQCGAPQLPYCTQINCKEGEANAGACPTGFACQTFPGFPSFCMKQ